MYVPFSIRGTRRNVADEIRVRPGAIELALKIPPASEASADPDHRTRVLQVSGRFAAYTCAFRFENLVDIPYVVNLICACEGSAR